jgi:hypothetical protein
MPPNLIKYLPNWSEKTVTNLPHYGTDRCADADQSLT